MQIVYGKEYYCINKFLEEFKRKYDVLIKTDISKKDLIFLNSVGFLSEKDKKLIYICDDVKKIRKLEDCFTKSKDFVVVYFGNLSKNENFMSNQEIREYGKLNYNQLANFISNNVPFLKGALLKKFIELSQYLEDEDVNLYDITSEIKKFQCLSTVEVDEEILLEVMGNRDVQGDAFKEGQYLVSQDPRAITNVISCPKGNELGYIGALQRFFRVGWKKNHFTDSVIGYGASVNSSLASSALKILDEAFSLSVSGKLQPRIALVEAVIRISMEVEKCLNTN